MPEPPDQPDIDQLYTLAAEGNRAARSALCARVASGDRAAWEPFYRVYRRIVLGYLLSDGVSDSEAESLTQEAFRRIFERVAVRPIEELKMPAYAVRIARNRLVEEYRLFRRERRIPPAADGEEALDFLGHVESDFENRIDVARLVENFRELLDRQPARTREIVQGHLVRGEDHDVIADRLNITENAVRQVVWRFRQDLRSLHGWIPG